MGVATVVIPIATREARILKGFFLLHSRGGVERGAGGSCPPSQGQTKYKLSFG